MANNGRSAEKTTKGYYYQFDYSIGMQTEKALRPLYKRELSR